MLPHRGARRWIDGLCDPECSGAQVKGGTFLGIPITLSTEAEGDSTAGGGNGSKSFGWQAGSPRAPVCTLQCCIDPSAHFFELVLCGMQGPATMTVATAEAVASTVTGVTAVVVGASVASAVAGSVAASVAGGVGGAAGGTVAGGLLA